MGLVALSSAIAATYVSLWSETPEPIQDQEVTDNYTYDQILASNKPETIIDYIQDIQFTVTAPIPVQVDALTKRINLASRVREIQGKDESPFADEMIIDSQYLIERLNVRNGMSTFITREQLSVWIEQFKDHSDSAIRAKSIESKVFLDSFKVAESESTNNPTTVDRLVRSMKQLEAEVSDVSYVPKTVIGFAEEFAQVDGLANSITLFDVVIDNYQDRSDPEIVEAVKIANSVANSRRYNTRMDLASVIKMQKQVSQSNIEKAELLIRELSENDPRDPRSYLELINSIMLVVQSGEYRDVQRLIEDATPLFEDNPKSKKYRSSFQYLANVGTNLGKSVVFPEFGERTKDKPSLVLFCKPGSIGAAQKTVGEFAAFANPFIEAGDMEFLTVFLNDELSSEESERFGKWMGSYENVGVLNVSAEQSNRLLSRFPMPFSPSWMLLDEQNRLLQFNTPRQILEFQILKLLGKVNIR